MTDKIKLLVVDDELKFLNPVAKRLELRGFDVTKAASGQEALDYLEECEFELAILDLKMPGVDGKRVLQMIKERQSFVEVIVMTGHGSAEAAVECMKMGAFSYLPKPYELEKILEILRQAYAARLKKKYGTHSNLMRTLETLERTSDPLEALKFMKAMVR